MSIKHRHMPVHEKTEIRPYKHPVGDNPNPLARGGKCKIETCICGARRRINVNGFHAEIGPWEGGVELSRSSVNPRRVVGKRKKKKAA